MFPSQVSDMKKQILIALMLLSIDGAAGTSTKMIVGDGQVDGRKVESFELTWQQCAFQDDQWVSQGTVTEALTPIGDTVMRLRRDVRQSNGVTGMTTTYFDRASFAPIRMETEVTAADGSLLAHSQRDLTADGYRGFAVRGAEKKPVEGAVSSNMLDGGSLGLPLATIAYQEQPLEFLASMMSFDASYRVRAEWVGREVLEHGDQQVEAWMIDIEWHHKELGDVYPPGPDASGGRYWVVPNPPDGFPYVPRYKTDTYAVEFIKGVCLRD